MVCSFHEAILVEYLPLLTTIFLYTSLITCEKSHIS